MLRKTILILLVSILPIYSSKPDQKCITETIKVATEIATEEVKEFAQNHPLIARVVTGAEAASICAALIHTLHAQSLKSGLAFWAGLHCSALGILGFYASAKIFEFFDTMGSQSQTTGNNYIPKEAFIAPAIAHNTNVALGGGMITGIALLVSCALLQVGVKTSLSIDILKVLESLGTQCGA